MNPILHALRRACGLAFLAAHLGRISAADPGPPALPSPGLDTDQDRLSDREEVLFGSDPRRRDSDGDGQDDWLEAHNMTSPNRAPYAPAAWVDRFRFDTPTGRSDAGVAPLAPLPPESNWVESFAGHAFRFPAADPAPLTYSLVDRPLDLAHGMVRFWYVPEGSMDAGEPGNVGDAAWRTLLHARGTRGAEVYEWLLELHPGDRQLSLRTTRGDGELRQVFRGNLPAAVPARPDAFEICVSYTSGTTWVAVHGDLLYSRVFLEPGRPLGLGVDRAGMERLMACPDRRLAIGGRMTGATTSDRPARGVIDEVEWCNAAMGRPFPFPRMSTPWAATRDAVDLRRFGGWATSRSDGDGIDIHLRRGWEGPIPSAASEKDPYRLERREWGATGPFAWQVVGRGTRAERIEDRTVTPGRWYEYRLPAESVNRGPSIWGHAGPRPPLGAGPGFSVVVGVDRTLLEGEGTEGRLRGALSDYLTALRSAYGPENVALVDTLRRMDDAAWQDGSLEDREGRAPIFEVGTPENQAYQRDLRANKDAVKEAFGRIPGPPGRVRLLVLVGHVTVPLSGVGAEDGHVRPLQVAPGVWQPAHAGAWACDAWYGDFDGIWTDAQEASAGASCRVDGKPRTDWQSRNVPGDGKFDQASVPANGAGEVALEAAVGRIDFAKLPGFRTAAEVARGEAGARSAEARLTAAYLEKATAYRRGNGPRPMIGVVRTLFGSPSPPAMPCLPEFMTLVPPAIVASTRQFDGALPDSAWEDLFDVGPTSLWGFHGGYGSYTSIQGTFGAIRGTAEMARWSTATGAERAGIPERWCHAFFVMLSGSFLANWNHEPEDLFQGGPVRRMGAGNLLKAILAQEQGGLGVFCQLPTRVGGESIVLSRAAVGFPVGVALLDTVELHPRFPLHALFLLGDPTLIPR